MRTNSLDITIYSSVGDAPKYAVPEFKAGQIEKACIVRYGTEGGNSTVDLIFSDAVTGQKYVAMLTGRLIKMLAVTIGGENNND